MRPGLDKEYDRLEGSHVSRTQEDPADAADRQTKSLAALALTLFLVVTGLYLVQTIRAQSLYQDCVLTGRQGCVVVAGR
jgi:hypothetical protein